MTNDGELLKRMQKGQRSAMEEFYRRHSPYLFAVCRRYLSEYEDAKDVLQESFISMFAAIDRLSLKEGATLRSWATRIVVNRALNMIRDRRVFLSIEEDLAEEIADEEIAVELIPPDDLQEIIRQLPVGYRTIFNLFAIERMSHKEIAAQLGISPSTSASQYHRAKQILKQRIKNYQSKKQ